MITASNETLMRQATMTAEVYMLNGIRMIDERFGEGYAESNPKLLGAFIQAASMDYAAAIITKGIQEVASSLELAGMNLDGLTDGICGVAEAIEGDKG